MPMIVFDESEYLQSDFTDEQLVSILDTFGPHVKDEFLWRRPVPIMMGVQHDNRVVIRA